MIDNKEDFHFPFDSSWNTLDMYEYKKFEDTPITSPPLKSKIFDNPIYTMPSNADKPSPGFPDTDLGIDSNTPGPSDPGYPFGPSTAPYYPPFPGDPNYIGYPYGPGDPKYPYGPSGPGGTALGPDKNHPGFPSYPYGPGGSLFPGPDGGWPGGWPHSGSPGKKGWGYPYSSGSEIINTENECKYKKGLTGPWGDLLQPKCNRGYVSNYDYEQIPIPAYPQFWPQQGVRMPLPLPVQDLSSISATPGFMF